LRCRRSWEPRIEKPTKCPWCGSYHLIDDKMFERIVNEAERLIKEGLPARFPMIDIFRAIIRELGLLQLLKADETLNLAELVFEELERRHGPYWFMRYVIFGGWRWER